jgi:O-acetyl-ADP-ribose deacetylase (regulator of RNase III)
VVVVATLAGMPEWRVAVGDIAAADVDLVVVSANTSLDFEGRAGRALADVCGPQVAVELATIRARRDVRVGEVCATTAGRHPRIKAIFWAVVRDHRPAAFDDVDDVAAVGAAARALWRALLEVKRRKPLTIALVPVGALEIGAARSAELFARTLLAEPRVHSRLARVTVMTTMAADLPSIEAALRSVGARAAKTTSTTLDDRTLPAPHHAAIDDEHDEPADEDLPTLPLAAPRHPAGWSDEATVTLKRPKPR